MKYYSKPKVKTNLIAPNYRTTAWALSLTGHYRYLCHFIRMMRVYANLIAGPALMI
jgi:hypothetical protein